MVFQRSAVCANIPFDGHSCFPGEYMFDRVYDAVLKIIVVQNDHPKGMVCHTLPCWTVSSNELSWPSQKPTTPARDKFV